MKTLPYRNGEICAEYVYAECGIWNWKDVYSVVTGIPVTGGKKHMKKLLMAVLAGMMLVGCGQKKTEEPTEAPAEPTAEATAEPTQKQRQNRQKMQVHCLADGRLTQSTTPLWQTAMSHGLSKRSKD